MIATILAVLVILFMILPIFILYPISFSPTSYIVFPNEGFSTQWYEKLFSDPLWAQAVQNSIVIAIFTTILSLLLGTIAAVCMNRFSHKWKTVLGEYFRLPTDHSDHCNGNFYLRAAFKMATQRNSAGTGDRTYGNCSSVCRYDDECRHGNYK